MGQYTVSLSELPERLQADMRALQNRARVAVKLTIYEGVPIVVANTPKAFGELRDSIHPLIRANGDMSIYVDAPHAAAVEVGSRPHLPPLEPILKWVMLRGIQGLTPGGRVSRRTKYSRATLDRIGHTTPAQSRRVAQSLVNILKNSDVTPKEAAVRVANSIRFGIAKNGTRPHRYMLRSIPAILELLKSNLEKAIKY